MPEVDMFAIYVRRELDHWGHEFAMHRDCEYLGHASKNMLQVLIDHKGEMPGRVTGFKPMDTDDRAQRMEYVVLQVARQNLTMACVLRAYYCGSGRRKVERLETANELIARAGLRPVKVSSYLDLVKRGTAEVGSILRGLEIAA